MYKHKNKYCTGERKTFIINDNGEPKKVISGGLIFYKQEKILIQICDSDLEKDKITDFGGKSEKTDDTAWHMAMREAYEETNLNMPDMIGNVSRWVGFLYVLYMVEVPSDWGDDISFGSAEVSHDGFTRKRKVEWVDINDLKPSHLTGRIVKAYDFIKRVVEGREKTGYDLQASWTQYMKKRFRAFNRK